MSLNLPEVSSERVAQLVQDLETVGFACIPNYVRDEDLQRMQSFVSDAVAKAGNEYVGFTGADSVAGSGLEELARSPRFEQLIHALYEQGTGKKAKKEEFYQVLRCLTGSTGKKNSLIFHYDSFVVTALVPIAIPAEGLAGDLLMYPNTRGIRGSYAANVVDKVLLDNPITQSLLRSCAKTGGKLSPVRIKMLPGNLYFFWGYRSIHTNEPCDPDKVRATALFHYHNPHQRQAASEGAVMTGAPSRVKAPELQEVNRG